MAKPKTNLIIEEFESDSNLFKVWLPMPVPAVEIIRAIEGVASVWHNVEQGSLWVWVNPCYDKGEVKAEIKAVTKAIRGE